MSADLVREYTHPKELVSPSQGNVQVLPNGNVFIGWGSEPFFSEYSNDGELLFDAGFPPVASSPTGLSASRGPGTPDDPAVAVERGSDDEVTLYASWNGATEVADLAGARRPRPRPARTPPDPLPSAASRPPLR